MNKAVIGALLGAAIPLTLGLANEALFLQKQITSGVRIRDAFQFCAFERRWFPLYPKVIYATGCSNKTADVLVPLFLITSLGGALLGAVTEKTTGYLSQGNEELGQPSIRMGDVAQVLAKDGSESAEHTKQSAMPLRLPLRILSTGQSITNYLGRSIVNKRLTYPILAVAATSGAIIFFQMSRGVIRPGAQSNISKVLDRVKCHRDYTTLLAFPTGARVCEQERVDKIWNLCLRSGYADVPPSQRVKSSREMEELVEETTYQKQTRLVPREVTNNNGVVGIVEVEEHYDKPVTVKGYCIGSEYILE